MTEQKYIISEKNFKIVSTVQTILVILLFILLVFSNFGFSIVPTPSMEPTIMAGTPIVFDFTTADDLNYGDVVFFFYEKDESLQLNNALEVLYQHRISDKTIYAKRLMGKPGDVFEIRDYYLYRNGEKLYDVPEVLETMEPYVVPEGTFYCLGDNRAESYDSIYCGAFDQNLFFGKLLCCLS